MHPITEVTIVYMYISARVSYKGLGEGIMSGSLSWGVKFKTSLTTFYTRYENCSRYASELTYIVDINDIFSSSLQCFTCLSHPSPSESTTFNVELCDKHIPSLEIL